MTTANAAGTVYRLIDELRVALQVAAAADVTVEQVTAAQAAADQAWAEVARLRRELFESIQVDALEVAP